MSKFRLSSVSSSLSKSKSGSHLISGEKIIDVLVKSQCRSSPHCIITLQLPNNGVPWQSPATCSPVDIDQPWLSHDSSYYSSPQPPFFLTAYRPRTTLLPALGAPRNPLMNLRPYVISPDNGYYEIEVLDRAWRSLSIADNVCNALLAIDIIINFFVAYMDKSTYLLVDTHKEIAMKYGTSCLALDVMSTIPTEVVWSILPIPLKEYGLFSLIRLWSLKRVFDPIPDNSAESVSSSVGGVPVKSQSANHGYGFPMQPPKICFKGRRQ